MFDVVDPKELVLDVNTRRPRAGNGHDAGSLELGGLRDKGIAHAASD